MALKDRYHRAKAQLLKDPAVCRENRELFTAFFTFEEYKLKRMNGRPSLDDNSYKTLLSYVSRLRVVNRWFRNKDWKKLDKADIQKVYDDLEDGKIRSTRGGGILRDKRTYYTKIFRGKPFELAGKKELVEAVMQFAPTQVTREVRFIKEVDFRRLVDLTSKLEHRAFLWLCWDIGENATAILKLRKRDCVRQINEETKEVEYLINLRKDILKRSRRERSEITNYRETTQYLDLLLKDLEDDDLLFDFGEGWAKKLLIRLVQKTGVRCLPGGQNVTLKDLRSSMACDLLSKGWSRDEVNARLGHAPSSREIDRYINYLALDKVRTKKKVHDHEVQRLLAELAQIRDREKLMNHRLNQLKESSELEVAQLSERLAINTELTKLVIGRQLGRVTQRKYVQRLRTLHRELTA